jgi:hypothetical protein
MTGTNCDLFTHKSSRSYLNHLVHTCCKCQSKKLQLASTQNLNRVIYQGISEEKFRGLPREFMSLHPVTGPYLMNY